MRVSSWSEACQLQLRRLVGYLAATKDEVLRFRFAIADIKGALLAPLIYSDADLASPKSQSGWVVGVAGPGGSWAPLLWSSRAQGVAADSTTAAETLAAASALKGATVLCRELSESMFGLQDAPPTPLMVDLMSLIKVASHGSSMPLGIYAKCVSLRLALLRDVQALKLVSFRYVNTQLNRANLLTKVLDGRSLARERALVGIVDTGAPVSSVLSTTVISGDTWPIHEKYLVRFHNQPRRRLFSPAPDFLYSSTALCLQDLCADRNLDQ